MIVVNDEICTHAITTALHELDVWSQDSHRLLLATALTEIHLNSQKTDNSAPKDSQTIGIFNLSSKQHRDIWDQYLAFQPDIASTVRGLASQRHFLQNPDHELESNWTYAAAIAWITYQVNGVNIHQLDGSPLSLTELWQQTFPSSSNKADSSFFLRQLILMPEAQPPQNIPNIAVA